MRKLISLGVLALLLAVLASPVSADADSKVICKELKGASKGLYGLCVAYWNTEDGNARDKIYENFYKRAGPDGEDMPYPDAKKPEVVECPCWSNEDLLRAACTAEYWDSWFSGDGVNLDLVSYDEEKLVFLADGTIDSSGEIATNCSLLVSGVGYTAIWDSPTDSNQNLECRAGLQVLMDLLEEDLSDLCP